MKFNCGLHSLVSVLIVEVKVVAAKEAKTPSHFDEVEDFTMKAREKACLLSCEICLSRFFIS